MIKNQSKKLKNLDITQLMANYTAFGKLAKKKEEPKLVGNVIEVSTRDEKISILKKTIETGQLVVVDVYSDSCQPCKMIAPKYYEFSNKYPMVIFLKEKVELEISPGVSNVPCFQFFGGAKLIENVLGADPMKLEATIQKYLSVPSVSGNKEETGQPPTPSKPVQPLPPPGNRKPHGIRK
jgi:thioredoxin 1